MTEITENQEREAQILDQELDDEGRAKANSVEGAVQCYLREEIDGDELDAIFDENR